MSIKIFVVLLKSKRLLPFSGTALLLFLVKEFHCSPCFYLAFVALDFCSNVGRISSLRLSKIQCQVYNSFHSSLFSDCLFFHFLIININNFVSFLVKFSQHIPFNQYHQLKEFFIKIFILMN